MDKQKTVGSSPKQEESLQFPLVDSQQGSILNKPKCPLSDSSNCHLRITSLSKAEISVLCKGKQENIRQTSIYR
jgi:hypothetical protein